MYRKPLLGIILLSWTLFPGTEALFAANPSEHAEREIPQQNTALANQEFLAKADIHEHSISRPRAPRPESLQTTWITETGLVPQSQALLNRIREAEQEGLNPARYDLSRVDALLEEMQEAGEEERPLPTEKIKEMDSFLSRIFLTFGSHLLKGQVDPGQVHSRYGIRSETVSWPEILSTALETKEMDAALETFRPKHPDYVALKQALRLHREIKDKGGWPEIQEGATLRNGDHNDRVTLLRSHLIASGDLEEASEQEDSFFFDDQLEKAVRGFQKRHGCKADGVVGHETRAALNVTVEQRIRQIQLNLERWRWLPRDLGERYILVNTANFELQVKEKARSVMRMRVISGKKQRPTPMLSGTMTYLVLNPFWNIPHKIAREDIFPRIKKDPGYLVRENIRVFESWEPEAPELDAESIDWERITKWDFSFKLRQDAGPRNALGQVKIMFPNKFAVYLHDTPSKNLFQREMRDLSSGCVRIEKPVELLTYLFRDDSTWSRERFLHEIEGRERRIIALKDPVPVYLLYWTAWVDEEGTVHFREDHYGRDRSLERALRETPADSGKG